MIPQVERFFRRVKGRGWDCRMVPLSHLTGLEEAIGNPYGQGLLDKTLYKRYLSPFSYTTPFDFAPACSIMIVAVPTPPMRVFFRWQGERVPVIIPPTYVSYTSRTERVQAVLAAWLHLEGFHLAKPDLPLKTLAVRSGLAFYGRNNISFVPGMGSFFQLVGAFSDLPCDGDPWQEPASLYRCASCTACVKLCPTGAITADRFLLHAERCLTFHNEAPADFPGWIELSWHHCLVGCMRCQTACPENKVFAGWFEDRAEFSEDETTLLIRQTPPGQLSVETASKIKALEINEDYFALCRNLSMVLRPEA